MYWIVVADGVTARFFELDDPEASLQKTDTLENEDGRARDQDMEDDRPGRFSKGGGGRGAYQKKSARDVSEERFASRVAEHIEKNRDAFSSLVLFAAPRFLGQLRKELSKTTKKRLAGERAVNATKESREELLKRVRKILSE